MRKSKGFTLIEMLIVIFIISVLASLITVNLSDARKRGRDTRRKEDLKVISSALELYNTSNNSYPTNSYVSNGCIWDLTDLMSECSGGNNPWISELSAQYISSLPVDPINNLKKVSEFPAFNSTLFAYGYYSVATSSLESGEWFMLTALLEVADSSDSIGKTQAIDPSDDVNTYVSNGWKPDGYILTVR